MDLPSAQLQQELRDAITRELQTRRPLLHHLNADSSWLLQIPRPLAATKRGGRVYYNILLDPWLAGGQSDIASWFSQQWHATESATPSVAAVEELARETEKGREPNGPDTGSEIQTFVDAVVVSHEFTDHCHRETLTTVDPDVPVFATQKAADLIRSWNHFRQVSLIPPFTKEDADWRSAALPPLPEWLSISRLQEPGDALYYHSAVMIAFNTALPQPTQDHASSSARTMPNGWSAPIDGADAAECVIYTPHGIRAEAVEPVAEASPSLSTLAFLHGLHDITLGKAQQLNLGGKNGLQCQRILRAKYWVGTHDEVKKGYGLVSWFLKRKIISVEHAIKEEQNNGLYRPEKGDEALWKDVSFTEVPNGESRVLR
ncbi:uncharacterized protein K452DRAFT_360271 [Aplosporella prunicola CBS 121167]|uniref:Uncharacterized protein n=1 Tax=Aplosporella prunicola CBS 121167 TaxID=1176127 RepID=A0A6A6B9U9_9PEZI|nr:uncharacterized protein K452DRAFT_360271 [Aplosporella prunicola CBS 121167]KAF2140085.1 hypothetical protein K452DRAFT_360271 [Aplosporella prunicola CBS 121167]